MKKALINLTVTALAMVVVMLAGCSVRTSNKQENFDSVVDSDTKVIVYETKYCDLKYPDKWMDKVKIEVDESGVYTVKLAMEDGTPVFDLIFNGNTGSILGTIVGKDQNTVIRLKDYTMDESDSRYGEFCEIAESVNVIINNLIADYSFAVGEEIEKEDNSTFEINTSIATMYYPAKWEGKVDIDMAENVVKFSYKDHELFDLYFGSDEGYLLGTYDGVSVSIVSYDIDESVMSEDEYYELCAMQEDVNVILQHLMEDKAFVITN